MGLYSCGKIERFGSIQLWEHRAVGLYSCGNIELWVYTDAGT